MEAQGGTMANCKREMRGKDEKRGLWEEKDEEEDKRGREGAPR